MRLYCKKCDRTVEPVIKDRSIHKTAFCPFCDSYIKHVTQKDRKSFTLYFGKYSGQDVRELAKTKDGYQYLAWLLANATNLRGWQKEILEEILQ